MLCFSPLVVFIFLRLSTWLPLEAHAETAYSKPGRVKIRAVLQANRLPSRRGSTNLRDRISLTLTENSSGITRPDGVVKFIKFLLQCLKTKFGKYL